MIHCSRFLLFISLTFSPILLSFSHGLYHYFESGTRNRQASEVFIVNLLQSTTLITVADALLGQFQDVALVVFTATVGVFSCYFLPKLLENPLILSLYPNMLMFFEKQVISTPTLLIDILFSTVHAFVMAASYIFVAVYA